MADLVVDTDLLRAAARELTTLATVADGLGDGQARLGEAVWAVGSHRAGQGLDSFLCAWTYGLRCIASQAAEVGNDLKRSALAYESAEAMLATAAGGRVAGWPLLDSPTPVHVPEPQRPARRFTGGPTVPVQLSAARHAGELIPGEPEQAAAAGRMLLRFADDLVDARLALARVSLGSWVGAAAAAMVGELGQLAKRLGVAEAAFADAGTAVAAYARAHGDAQADAARALAMWRSAEQASAVARGAVAGVAAGGVPAEPDAVLARAAALAREARERFETAGHVLASVLEQAEAGSPNDPGLFAVIRRGIVSFATGVAEGVWGIGEGAVVLAGLAVRLSPARAIWDPHGYLAAHDSLATGVQNAVRNPAAVGRALADWDTWREDPARAAGRLVPDLVGIVLTAGAAGAARGTAASNRLRSAAATIDEANRRGVSVFDSGDADLIARRLDELRLEPAGAAGRATRQQLQPPFGDVDQWVPVRLAPGEHVLVDANGFMAPFGGRVPFDARMWFEDLQVPPQRDRLTDGSISDPQYPSQVFVLEVGADGLDAAGATALANPHFGVGGGSRLAVPDLATEIAEGRLVPRGVHDFAPDTRAARIEDPRYRQVDPTLPERPLDPAREEVVGRVVGGAQEAGETVRNMALTTGAAGALDQIEQGAP